MRDVETEEQNADFQRLHQLIAGTGNVKGFVDGMTRYAATTLSRVTGARIECAVTLWRRKRAATLAGSSDEAILLDGIEQSLGAGPVLEAVETSQPVLLEDTQTDERWPKYSKNVAAAGARSVLGVPLALGNDASGALNFFAPTTGLFNQVAIAEATQFADMAAQALRLALRIASADLLAEDLRAAMERRTAIDIATGIVMNESRCSQDEAFEFLIRASQNRNQKVHDLAEAIVAGVSGAKGKTTTHFQD